VTGPVRRLSLVLAFLLLASTATAATIRGTRDAELIVGTQAADRVVAGPGADRLQVAFGGADRVDCGAGVDLVSADATDRLAANCEVVSRRLSVDPYANADSQHESAVEPDSFSWGSTVVAAFQVGRRQSGAAANIGTAASADGGRTWTRALLPGLTVNATPPGAETAASDPTVAYDSVHGTWLVASLTIARNASHVYVARSTDGVHWSAPVDVASGPILDKEWIVCDNGSASPLKGRCYVEYTDDQKNITVSQFSTDGGATWSQPVRAGSFLVGTQPVVLPNGALVVVAGDYRDEEAQSGSIAALRSADGGATFSRSTVSDLQAADNAPMRAIALPSLDVDSAGTIYAVWHDCRFRQGCLRNDLVLSTSTDGLSWSPPARIPLTEPTSQLSAFIPGLAADPTRPGHLGLVYAYYPSGSSVLGIAFIQSRDGGRTWAGRQRLDAQPMQVTWLPEADGGRMAGDYFSVSFAGSRVVPVFALATSPLRGRSREAIFAASLPALG
jgi:BNR repeat-like domain